MAQWEQAIKASRKGDAEVTQIPTTYQKHPAQGLSRGWTSQNFSGSAARHRETSQLLSFLEVS